MVPLSQLGSSCISVGPNLQHHLFWTILQRHPSWARVEALLTKADHEGEVSAQRGWIEAAPCWTTGRRGGDDSGFGNHHSGGEVHFKCVVRFSVPCPSCHDVQFLGL